MLLTLSRVDLQEFASVLKGLGFINAINMDGGGSTTSILNGTLISYPSDSWYVCVCLCLEIYACVCVCVCVCECESGVCVCVCAHTCACPLCVCLYFVCMCARVYYVICMQLHVCLYLRDVRRTRICVNARFEFTWGKERKKMRVNKKELASEHDYACVCACFLTNNTSSTA